MTENITQKLEEWKERYGFLQAAWIPLEKPLTLEIYKTWLQNGYEAEMHYLRDHLPLKAEPNQAFPKARSVLSVSWSYQPHPRKLANQPLQHSRLARYARGEDYHRFLKQKLQELIAELQELHPSEQFWACTDAEPILERDVAQQAGLGWVGKNSCVIHPKHGSLFFLSEIVSTLQMEKSPAPLPDFCGTCNRCIEACPTQALEKPRVLNANKCISYWTIESRKVAPQDLRVKFQDWMFGCDICQTVCPWNQKVFREQIEDPPADRQNLAAELRWLLTSSNKTIEKTLLGSPLRRAGPFGLKRNALIVAANLGFTELTPEISTYQDHERLGELARWALKQLECSKILDQNVPKFP